MKIRKSKLFRWIFIQENIQPKSDFLTGTDRRPTGGSTAPYNVSNKPPYESLVIPRKRPPGGRNWHYWKHYLEKKTGLRANICHRCGDSDKQFLEPIPMRSFCTYFLRIWRTSNAQTFRLKTGSLWPRSTGSLQTLLTPFFCIFFREKDGVRTRDQ